MQERIACSSIFVVGTSQPFDRSCREKDLSRPEQKKWNPTSMGGAATRKIGEKNILIIA